MLCSLYNTVSSGSVRLGDHHDACARSNGGMHMHSYHGGYPTISHSFIYTLKPSKHSYSNADMICAFVIIPECHDITKLNMKKSRMLNISVAKTSANMIYNTIT
jgi:hypothetical protein